MDISTWLDWEMGLCSCRHPVRSDATGCDCTVQQHDVRCILQSQEFEQRYQMYQMNNTRFATRRSFHEHNQKVIEGNDWLRAMTLHPLNCFDPKCAVAVAYQFQLELWTETIWPRWRRVPNRSLGLFISLEAMAATAAGSSSVNMGWKGCYARQGIGEYPRSRLS